MTDKQIIIDGVDVSGCKKYEHEIARCNATLKNMCFCGGRCTDKKNSDCYYKKWKRTEYELQAKEQECEELKSDLTDLSKIVDCKNGTILTFKEQLNQLKQTLAEIKEICNEC